MIKALILSTLLFSMQAAYGQTEEQIAEKKNLLIEQNYIEIADMMAQSFNQHGACGYMEVYTPDMVDTVRNARRYFDANYTFNQMTGRLFTITPATTQALATTLALKDIMNMLDLERPETFEIALNRVVMWGPAPGAYGNISSIKFGANGAATLGHLEFYDEDPYYSWIETAATFSVQSRDYNSVTVTITEGSDSTDYILRKNWSADQMWEMVPADQPDVNSWLEGFVDYPSECDA